MKVTVYFKEPTPGITTPTGGMVFHKVSEALVTEDNTTLNIRHGDVVAPGTKQVLCRIPLANIQHWDVEQ